VNVSAADFDRSRVGGDRSFAAAAPSGRVWGRMMESFGTFMRITESLDT